MRKRENNSIRDLKITTNYLKEPEGSCLIEMGNTKIIVTAMVEDKVPFFLKNTGKGWLSAEYSMIPGSTKIRKQRDITRGKIDGRNQEIQRLVGRSLRAAIDLDKIGEKTIWIDCDVISADGGTRTASIIGGYVALKLAIKKMISYKVIEENPLKEKIAAISVGKVQGNILLDLEYSEDSIADVDMNVVMNSKHEIIEIQGTSERNPMNIDEMNEMILLAKDGIDKIFKIIDQKVPDENIYVLATDNMNKVLEIEKIMENIPITLKTKSQEGLKDFEVEENGESIEENALIKARAIKEALGCRNVISDDTGLFVDELNGDPGVYSARYASIHDDEKNIDKLLKNLGDSENRKAHFRTSIALIEEDGSEKLFSGKIDGVIIKERRGNGGFGYDSVFVPEGYDKTFAELGDEIKNKISHRAKAIENLKGYLNYKYKC